jgi:Uma2 family endonuclease
MTKFAYIPKYTYEDYKQWEGRWELIEGIAYAMTPLPSIKHQSISHKIAEHLGFLLKNCKKCTPMLPVDWKINDETILQPDNSIICYPLEDVNFITKAPTVIFEILSPSTATKDKIIKYEIYQEQKVKYYIIVDPKTNSADILELKDNNYQKMLSTNNDKFSFDLEECVIDFDFSLIW